MDPSDTHRPLVLAVDDNEAVLSTIQLELEECFEIVCTSEAVKALEIFQSDGVAAVLLDVRMPGIDGLEILRRMKATKPRVEIILVSGLTDPETVVNGMRLGAFDYITKPWDRKDLISRVRRAVNRSRGELGYLALVGPEVGLVASLKAILENQVPARLGPLSNMAAWMPAEADPWVVFLDVGLETSVANVLLESHRQFPRSAMIVVGADEQSIPSLFPELRRSVFLSRQLSLNDFGGRILTCLRACGGPHALWPDLGKSVLRAIGFVRQHYAQPPLVADIARVVAQSDTNLGRMFHQSLGMSVKEYVTRVRLSAAEYSLASGEQTVDEIARELGFSSASHLSHIFLKWRGLRPGEYRRRSLKLAV